MKNAILTSSLVLICLFTIGQTNNPTTTKPSFGLANGSPIDTKVDTIAAFPGGKPAWNDYIGKNLNIIAAVENGAKNGKYNVLINFIVTKDGSLTGFEAVSKCGYGMEDEVIRILKLSPKWVPAKVKGASVDSYTQQKQVYIISGN